MSNWIEEAAEEIDDLVNESLKQDRIMLYGREKLADIILSHAPVIDAGKLAEKIVQKVDAQLETNREKMLHDKFSLSVGWIRPEQHIAQLITDNIDLKIEWVDGKAEWGRFSLSIWEAGVGWCWVVGILDYEDTIEDVILVCPDGEKSQELAEQACVTALRKILTGVKE